MDIIKNQLYTAKERETRDSVYQLARRVPADELPVIVE